MNLRSIILSVAVAIALAHSNVSAESTTTTISSAAQTAASISSTTVSPTSTTAAPVLPAGKLPTTTAPPGTTTKPGTNTVTATPKPTPASSTTPSEYGSSGPKPTPAASKTPSNNGSSTPKPTPAASTPSTAKLVCCEDVSVEGDATYCVEGPICSGSGDKPAGTKCPKAGDVAVKHCLKTLKSYVDASKCVAPVDAVCKKIKTGAWGCVWDTSAKSATPAPTPGKTEPGYGSTAVATTTKPTEAVTTPKPTPASSTTPSEYGSSGPKPTPAASKTPSNNGSSTPKPTPAASTPSTAKLVCCEDVSVEGDATYCVEGPICSGSGDKPAGTKCPKAGDVAVKHCLKTLKSYVDASKCVAPVDAVCKKIKTGAWGCVWDAATKSATATSTGYGSSSATTIKTANSTSTSGGMNTTVSTNVSVSKNTSASSSTTSSTVSSSTSVSTSTSVSPPMVGKANATQKAISLAATTTGSDGGNGVPTEAIAGVGAVGVVAVVALAVVYQRQKNKVDGSTYNEPMTPRL